MLTISKPLSAGQAQSYHAEEFGNARENYYTEAEQIRGEWHGRLAEQWGLRGEVREEHFRRLSEGQHPITGEQLIRHQAAREYLNRRGEKISAMEHRAGWDATFSAPKSVSLTALVGGDERVREAHRESVGVALDELERYVQARIGGNLPAETTGKWIAAKFEHDSARPVDGYAAPQLHTHVVFFQSYRDRRRRRTRATATGTVQDAAVCDGSVSLGTGPSVERTWLRNRARREQPAGNQRLQQRVSGSIESAPPADRGTSRKGKPARSRRGTDRRAPDARRKARTLTRRDARQAQRNGRAVRQSTRAGC